jgi:hypothetical protein
MRINTERGLVIRRLIKKWNLPPVLNRAKAQYIRVCAYLQHQLKR